MTIFGILWIIILLYCFRRNKDLAFLTIVSSTLQCSNVFLIGSVGLGPQIITSIVFCIKMIIYDKGRIVLWKKPVSTIFSVMLALFGFLIFTSIKNGAINDSIIKLFQLGIYIICFYFMFEIGKKLTNEEIYFFIRKLTIALLIIGFIQFGITSGVLPRLSIVGTLLYNDPNIQVVYYNADNWFRFTSTYMEPSYYSGFLDGAFFYFLANKEHRKNNYTLLAVIIFQILLTFSSTAYGVFAITGIVYFIFSKEMKFKFKLLLMAVAGFAFMMLAFPNVMNSVIFKKFSGQSYAGRRTGIMLAMEMFNKSPIFGNGYKTARGSSIIETMLAETGVVGFSIYIILIISFVMLIKEYKKITYTFMAGLAVLSAIFAQLIAVPDLDICTLWMWLNVFALHYFAMSSIKYSVCKV